MKKDQSVLLSGLGFYRMSMQRRKTLIIVVTVSLVLHVIGLAGFGGWIVMRHNTEDATTFVTPPPVRTYKPRELEHKVKVQKRQRSSSRPSLKPRIVAMKPSDLALPDIKMDPKIVNSTFQPKFKAVSGMGLGAGLGTGYGTSGFGSGISRVNFFGIHAKGERIAILVDVSVSMVEEERGGVEGYMRVKQRIEQVISALSPSTLFTTIAFADAAQTMKDELVVGTQDYKNKAKMFIRPYNIGGSWGLTSGNVTAEYLGIRATGGTTRLDLAITAAMRLSADTILLISDGLPRVRKGISPEQISQHHAARSRWSKENAGAMQAWDAANAGAQMVEEKIWVPPSPGHPATPAVPARPPSKSPPREGQPIDRGSPARPAQPAGPPQPGYFKVVTHRVGGARGARPSPPAPPAQSWWTLADFVTHITSMHEKYYVPKGAKLPVIHSIGYQIDNDGGEFLKKLAKQYRGEYRMVRRMR